MEKVNNFPVKKMRGRDNLRQFIHWDIVSMVAYQKVSLGARD